MQHLRRQKMRKNSKSLKKAQRRRRSSRGKVCVELRINQHDPRVVLSLI